MSDHLQRLQTAYDDRFAREYGPWRPVVAQVTDTFLACGVLDHGFARIRCDDCAHEYLLAFAARVAISAQVVTPNGSPSGRSGSTRRLSRGCRTGRSCSPSPNGCAPSVCIAAAGPRRIPLFFRTEKGAEVDLLFERGGRVEMVIEIKRSTAPTVSRGFRVACEDLSPGAAYVVHSGSESGPMPGGVRAISLLELLQHLGNTA